MKIESLKEVPLAKAKDIFLFDCQVVGLDSETRSVYRDVLALFIQFTGNILVKELTPDHVRLYIDNLSDGPGEGEEHIHTVIYQYAVIHDWIRWLYAQKFITERTSSVVKPPRYLTRRFDVLLGYTMLSPTGLRLVVGRLPSVKTKGAKQSHHCARGSLSNPFYPSNT